MSLRYQKRINLGNNIGFNISNSRISLSIPTKVISIGSTDVFCKKWNIQYNLQKTYSKNKSGYILFISNSKNSTYILT